MCSGWGASGVSGLLSPCPGDTSIPTPNTVSTLRGLATPLAGRWVLPPGSKAQQAGQRGGGAGAAGARAAEAGPGKGLRAVSREEAPRD